MDPGIVAEEGQAHKLTRQSLQCMGVSAMILRSTSRDWTSDWESLDAHEAKATGTPPQAELRREPSLLKEEELRAMLNDSFVELTGHPMPSAMTLEQGHAALRQKTVALWKGSLPPEEPKAINLRGSHDKSTRLTLRMGGLITRLSLRMGSASLKSIALARGLSEEDWDATLISLLAASYREVTGRAIPDGMSHAEAEAQLRALTIQTWQAEGWAETIVEEEGEEGSAKLDTDALGSGGSAPADPSPPLPPPPSAAAAAAAGQEDATEEEEEDSSSTSTDTDEVESATSARLQPAAAGRMAVVSFASNQEESAAVGEDMLAGTKRVMRNNKRLQTSKDLFRTAGAFQATSPKVCESWLTKKGPGLFKADKRRWFVLYENGDLHYFTDPDLKEHKGGLSLEGLSTADCELLGWVDVGKFAFTIKTSLRRWHFTTENESQCKAWKKNLDSTINLLTEKSSQK